MSIPEVKLNPILYGDIIREALELRYPNHPEYLPFSVINEFAIGGKEFIHGIYMFVSTTTEIIFEIDLVIFVINGTKFAFVPTEAKKLQNLLVFAALNIQKIRINVGPLTIRRFPQVTARIFQFLNNVADFTHVKSVKMVISVYLDGMNEFFDKMNKKNIALELKIMRVRDLNKLGKVYFDTLSIDINKSKLGPLFSRCECQVKTLNLLECSYSSLFSAGSVPSVKEVFLPFHHEKYYFDRPNALFTHLKKKFPNAEKIVGNLFWQTFYHDEIVKFMSAIKFASQPTIHIKIRFDEELSQEKVRNTLDSFDGRIKCYETGKNTLCWVDSANEFKTLSIVYTVVSDESSPE